MPHPETWLKPVSQGLFCEPGGFFIDPVAAVDRAIITHGHSDHARPGHRAVLATVPTLAIMRARLGEGAGRHQQPLAYGKPLRLGDVTITLQPAGHVLGSAQVVIDYAASRVVVSGDYKRASDPTCAGFIPIPCDLFVTEATFALPVFRHPEASGEIAKLLDNVRLFPHSTHVIGCYALGKCQRLIALLRQAGWHQPIFLHGALQSMCDVYETLGIHLGELRPATGATKAAMRGAIVLAPPGATADRWLHRMDQPVVGLASGWMQLRQRAKASGVELPLVISDHADWDALNATIEELDCPEIWVTHGREDALIHALALRGRRGRALRLLGYDDEDGSEKPLAEPAA